MVQVFWDIRRKYSRIQISTVILDSMGYDVCKQEYSRNIFRINFSRDTIREIHLKFQRMQN